MSRAENKEKYKEYDHNYYIKRKRPKSKIGQAELKISDLEAKLAESENKRKGLEEKVKFLTEDKEENFVDGQKYNELKQQLAEKYKTIENLRIDLKDYQDLEEKISTKYDEVVEKLKKADQDKISFAVEKIQDLKKSLRDKVCLMENDEHCYPQNAIHWQDVVALVDNQIKAIEGDEVVC